MLGHQLHALERAEALQEETRQAIMSHAEREGRLARALRELVEDYRRLQDSASQEARETARAFMGPSVAHAVVALGS